MSKNDWFSYVFLAVPPVSPTGSTCEDMLSKFYAPCQRDGRRSGSGQEPDRSALAAESSTLWEEVPGAKGRIAASLTVPRI